MARKSGLGRGLDSLIPGKSSAAQTKINNNRANTGKTTSDKADSSKGNKSRENSTVKKSTAAKKTKDTTTTDNVVKKTTDGKGTSRGASATVSKELSKTSNVVDEVINVKISKVEPNREQPRKSFNKEGLEELAASIGEYGVIQPILVKKEKDHYTIIAGERRWRAANMAGLKEVPVIVCDYDDMKSAEISLIENIQREDLNAIEQARAYQSLISDFNLRQEDVAKKVSKSRAAVTNSLRLLKLSAPAQSLLVKGEISEGHARTLLSLPDAKAQSDVAKKVAAEHLSVRETEKLVKRILNPKPMKRNGTKNDVNDLIFKDMEEQMRNALGTKVTIDHTGKNKGKIQIDYYSDEELERIIQLISSIH